MKNQSNAIEYYFSKELDFSKNLKNFFYLLIKKKRLFFVKKIIKNF